MVSLYALLSAIYGRNQTMFGIRYIKVPPSTYILVIFQETSSDFQEVTIQGQVTYRIADPKRVAGLLNYTLDRRGINYVSTDPEKLSQRVINIINVLTHKE